MRRQRKFKIQRKLNVLLPAFGDKKEKGPIAKRPFPPGFHGKTKNRRTSEFGLRLKEKQKIRFYYGLKEKQVRTLVIKSKRKESNWLTAFVDLVERRLDNLVFRLGFYPTLPAARQAVVHGHIKLNGKRCTIPSVIVFNAVALEAVPVKLPLKLPVALIFLNPEISLLASTTIAVSVVTVPSVILSFGKVG